MGTNIRCYTLFDITKTDVTNRKAPLNMSDKELSVWEYKRNTQCNLDTIMQVLSLRAQPERVTNTIEHIVNLTEFDNFGFLLPNLESCKIYSFDFYVNHQGVFYENGDELGALKIDCSGVTMIKIHDSQLELDDFLDTSPELCNIYFEVLGHE